MALRPTLKLGVNLPVQVQVRYADWTAHETFGEQMRVTVKLEEQYDDGNTVYDPGEYVLYVYKGAEDQLLDSGAVTEKAEKDGRRQFEVRRGTTATFTVRERAGATGKKHKEMEIEVLNAPGKRATPPPAGSASRGPSARPEPTAADRLTAARAYFLIGEGAFTSAMLAARALSAATGVELDKLDQRAVASLAATIVISARDVGAPRPTAGMTDRIRAVLDGQARPARATGKGRTATRPDTPTPDPSEDGGEERAGDDDLPF